ncbi:MAG TPA: hypothetical protein VLR69_11215 [Thermoanaerobaculia bacterium]|nr:hypothetical protein [Thermoanaerobaculia bacterium]
MSRSALFILPGLLILSLFVFGASVFPIPTGDSHAFVPPALLLKAGGGLRNPISDLTRQLDPTGQARYLQYPPLFPWIVAGLMARPTPSAAFLAIAGLNAVNVILCALLLVRAARFRPWWATAAALLGIATLLAGEQTGRPEVLATLWVLLAVHVHLALPPERSWLPVGVILGLLGATHPVGALLLGLLAVMAHAARLSTRSALGMSAGTLAVSLAVFAGLLAASPYGLRETLEGLRRHGGAVAARSSQGTLIPYWITNPGGTLYALPYLLLIALLAWRAARRELPVRSPALLAAALLPLLAVAWRTGVQIPELSYNVLLFAPAVFAANLRLAGGEAGGWPGRGTALAHGLTGLGYLRQLVLFGLFLTQGVPLTEARGAFQRLPAEARVAVTPSLWVVAEDYQRMTVFPLAEGPRAGQDAVMVQQSYTGLTSPPDLPGYRLTENRFLPLPGRLLGIKVANTVPGYGYAIYHPDPEASR